MSRVVGIINFKGGVGKTTTAISFGKGLVENGYKVLLVDADDSGNPSLSRILKTETKSSLSDLICDIVKKSKTRFDEDLTASIFHHDEGFDVLSSDSDIALFRNLITNIEDIRLQRAVLYNILEPLQAVYDYIVIDAAPTNNILTANLLMAADEIIIPSQAQFASIDAIEEVLIEVENAKRLNPQLEISGILITMVDRRAGYNAEKEADVRKLFEEEGVNLDVDDEERNVKVRVFKTHIPRSSAAEEYTETGKSLLEYRTDNSTSRAYRVFVDEYLQREIYIDGMKLKARMIKKAVSATELLEKIGLTDMVAATPVMTGKMPADINTVKKITDVLCCSQGEIVKINDKKGRLL